MAIDQNFDADVIVAGGGPAGAAAACYLARSGASVIVLDRAIFPRDKVCGDCVAPLALCELHALGVTQIDGFAQTNIARSGALYLDGEKLISLPFPEVNGLPQFGRVIPRVILDSFVVEAAKQAGARLMDGVALTGFSIQRDAVTAKVGGVAGAATLRARLLIGADGSNSTVARIMRGSLPPRQDRMVAARAYFSGIDGPETQLDVYINAGNFPGYCWLFPTGKGEANVGLGIPLETLPARDQTPAAMLRRLLREDPALAMRTRNATLQDKIVGWPLMTFDPDLPIIADRLMLIGDAAGLINPLNGEGIQYALLSARWASETVSLCLRDDDFSAEALGPFAARVERELACDMAVARLVVHCITNRALAPIWLQSMRILSARASSDQEYARIVGGIFAGLSPPRDALNLAVVSGTIEQVARTIASTVLAGPRGWTQLGVGAARIGLDVAYNVTTHPLGMVDWTAHAATRTMDFVFQATRQAIFNEPSSTNK